MFCKFIILLTFLAICLALPAVEQSYGSNSDPKDVKNYNQQWQSNPVSLTPEPQEFIKNITSTKFEKLDHDPILDDDEQIEMFLQNPQFNKQFKEFLIQLWRMYNAMLKGRITPMVTRTDDVSVNDIMRNPTFFNYLANLFGGPANISGFFANLLNQQNNQANNNNFVMSTTQTTSEETPITSTPNVNYTESTSNTLDSSEFYSERNVDSSSPNSDTDISISNSEQTTSDKFSPSSPLNDKFNIIISNQESNEPLNNNSFSDEFSSSVSSSQANQEPAKDVISSDDESSGVKPSQETINNIGLARLFHGATGSDMFNNQAPLQEINAEKANDNRLINSQNVLSSTDAPLNEVNSEKDNDDNMTNSQIASSLVEDQKIALKQAQNAKYNFSSEINDQISANYQMKSEVRQGGVTTGQYSYDDGNYWRTVSYVADDKGFRITKEVIRPTQIKNLTRQASVQNIFNGKKFQYKISDKDISKPKHKVKKNNE